jgi:hypothetical protein
MTLGSLKISKTFKTNCCWLNLKKIMAPLVKNEKKNPPLLPTIVIHMFEKRCDTFKGGGGKNLVSSMILGQFAWNIYIIKKQQ